VKHEQQQSNVETYGGGAFVQKYNTVNEMIRIRKKKQQIKEEYCL